MVTHSSALSSDHQEVNTLPTLTSQQPRILKANHTSSQTSSSKMKSKKIYTALSVLYKMPQKALKDPVSSTCTETQETSTKDSAMLQYCYHWALISLLLTSAGVGIQMASG